MTGRIRVRRFGGGLRRIAPASGALDQDGDPDLLLGDRAGRLAWFENVGSAQEPAWGMVDDDLMPDATRTPGEWIARYAAAEAMRRLIGVAQLPIPPTSTGSPRAGLLERSRATMLAAEVERLW